jgi:hypothetical protein
MDLVKGRVVAIGDLEIVTVTDFVKGRVVAIAVFERVLVTD